MRMSLRQHIALCNSNAKYRQNICMVMACIASMIIDQTPTTLLRASDDTPIANKKKKQGKRLHSSVQLQTQLHRTFIANKLHHRPFCISSAYPNEFICRGKTANRNSRTHLVIFSIAQVGPLVFLKFIKQSRNKGAW